MIPVKSVEVSAAEKDLRPLKALVRKGLPVAHPLRAALLADDDFVPEDEYPAKVKVWLRLLSLSGREDP